MFHGDDDGPEEEGGESSGEKKKEEEKDPNLIVSEGHDDPLNPQVSLTSLTSSLSCL